MRRILIISIFAAASYCLGAPALAAGGNCTSIQARCAMEAGGKCDRQTGHWCYGTYQGKHCGGTGAAFRACMARSGHPQNDESPTAATAAEPGKCTSVQARCIIEAGGYCDPRTGHWRIGYVFQRMYGGNYSTFMACLDRERTTRK